MKEISLDELPLYSPWPERLLTDWRAPALLDRTAREREFEEKYQRLLDAYQAHPSLRTYPALRNLEVNDEEVASSIGHHLYAKTLREAMESSVSRLLQYLRPEALLNGQVVDLGCGYGYLLHRLTLLTKNGIDVRGGELSPVAVELAGRMGLEVYPFDFCRDVCMPLSFDDPPAVVTTSYAIHQLTSARPAVELLAKYRDRIEVVVNLEPEEDHFGDGLLGLLRKRYGLANGYSADLLRVLHERDDVAIDVVEPAIIGANALLPATLTVWRFV